MDLTNGPRGLRADLRLIATSSLWKTPLYQAAGVQVRAMYQN